MATDLELAYAGLAGKQLRYNELWDYYDGRHPLVYNASKLQEIFGHIDAAFSENWSAVVVNAILDRVEIERFQVGEDEAADAALTDLWRETGLDLDAYDAHLCALVTGEAFIIGGLDDEGKPEAYFNDSRLVHMIYEDAKPHIPRVAAKWWEQGAPDGKGTETYLTLYYADRFEYYMANKARKDIGSASASAFEPLDPPTAPNPWAEIPVWHLRRERRAIRSELADIIAPQAMLNKMLSDMMITGEFGAYPQRFIISQMVETKGKFKNQPNEIWNIPASDGEGQGAAAGQFDAADLANFLQPIERAAGVIATLANIPKILLFAQGDIPSGASLRALEAPLVKKAKRYDARFESVWRKVLRWLLKVGANKEVDATAIDVVWAEPGTTQPEVDATTVKTLVEAGVPKRTALRRQGWTDKELDQMEEDEAEEQKAAATLASAMIGAAEANTNRQAAGGAFGNGNGKPPQGANNGRE